MRSIDDQGLSGLKQKHFSLNELLDHCARLVPLFSGKQVRYKVKDLPTERTIRYYVQQGLLDRPLRKGRSTVFTYRHLIQVLAVKKLQSSYFPLKKIVEITRSLNDEEFKSLLTADTSYLPTPVLPKSARSPVCDHSPPATFDVSSFGLDCAVWRKFKIDERMELHVEEQFDLDSPHVELDVIAARIMHVLSMLSARKGGWTSYDDESAHPLSCEGHQARAVSALPLSRLSDAVVALITEGGLVPKGNPDRLEGARASRFLKYPLTGISNLEKDAFESVDRGWDTTDVNADPDRLLPLDVMRDLEREKVIGRIYEYFFTTTGVATPVDVARQLGREIAAELKREKVSSAVFTAT
jgi:DNA-binding transcriptional MerR regulator